MLKRSKIFKALFKNVHVGKPELIGVTGKYAEEELISTPTFKAFSEIPYERLNDQHKVLLSAPTITFWDLVKSQSGGHKAITNITNLDLYRGRGKFTDMIKKLQADLVVELLTLKR